MFDAIEKIRQEMDVAKAQLEAARKAKQTALKVLSNNEILALMERIEYQRGRVEMAALLMSRIAKDMRQDAAEDAWRRKHAAV